MKLMARVLQQLSPAGGYQTYADLRASRMTKTSTPPDQVLQVKRRLSQRRPVRSTDALLSYHHGLPIKTRQR